MEQRIVEFVEVLRQNNLTVSLAETNDAVRAAALVGFESRRDLESALQSTLCKRSADLAIFKKAFEFYFSNVSKTFEALDASLAKRIREQGLVEGDDLKMILYLMNRLADQMSPLGQALVNGDQAALAKIFRNASLELDFSKVQNALQSGFYSRKLLGSAGMPTARSDLAAMQQELKDRGVSTEGLEIVSKHVAAVLREVEDAARGESSRQIKGRLKNSDLGLQDKKLHTLSRSEIALAQSAVKSLALKLKARLVRRQKSKRRGQLNPRVTLRKNLSTGGVPMVPYFRARRPQRPDVVVLCDVSDSVRNASRLMLLFAATLQSLFSRVRSFIFVSELGEATRFFKDTEPEEAIDAVMNSDVISMNSNSNYGHAFVTFLKRELGTLSRKTTVFVIGDGRNNFNSNGLSSLEALKRKAKRVVWLCTEPRSNWGFGDSEMLKYEKAVNQVVIVQSLGDLTAIAEELIP
jgi:uncharacterized protein